MTNIPALIKANGARWTACTIPTVFVPALDSTAHRLCAAAAKAQYLDVSSKTTVPWYVIAVIHEREASQSWKANLAQGDLWSKVSIHEPAGEGPFKSWAEAAVHALNEGPRAAHWKDWTPGGAMTLLEMYNGLGYANKGKPSPYVWASTNQYVKGKYVSDGHYDPNVVDKQEGCAAILIRMATMDDSVKFS
jgi:lysozyme family protein